MFKESVYKNIEDYKQEVNQDMVIMVNTVHDELNLGVDKFQLKPLLKKIVTLGTAKTIQDKMGMPYMNFLYDVEFSKTGEFTGENYEGVEDFSIYETPLHADEHLAKTRFENVINSFSIKQSIENITIDIKEFERLQLGSKIDKYILTDSNYETAINLTVTQDGKKYKYGKLLNTNIKTLLNKK